MPNTYDSYPTEVHFAPSFVHRLHFTLDVLGDDAAVLAEVLEPSEGRRARVQFWVDEFVAAGAIVLDHHR